MLPFNVSFCLMLANFCWASLLFSPFGNFLCHQLLLLFDRPLGSSNLFALKNCAFVTFLLLSIKVAICERSHMYLFTFLFQFFCQYVPCLLIPILTILWFQKLHVYIRKIDSNTLIQQENGQRTMRYLRS